MAEPQPPDGRRRRPAVSCALCRRRKIRCNRETPCSNCLRSRSEACVYVNESSSHVHLPSSPRRLTLDSARESNLAGADTASSTTSASTLPSRASTSLPTRSTGPSTPSSHLSAQDAESVRLKLRIRQLEDQLSKSNLMPNHSSVSTPQSNVSNVETASSRLGGTFHLHYGSGSPGQPHPAIARSVTHKTRLFGLSHWATSGVPLVRDIFEAIDPREEASSAWSGIERCKSLARIIKAQRAPSWPSPPTPELPNREICDALVDYYLQTTESIYRILHIPTFRRNYEALWASGVASFNTAFLVQLKLVLALGASLYDKRFSLRALAVRWVHEAQVWVAGPKYKSRLDIQSLQTNLLLLLAQERMGNGGDSIWISVGALLRKAVYMGLHRDPARLPPRTAFAAEMRRRLWNTILELTLQSSLTSGVPPFITLADFDTAPPGNFDDDQLVAGDQVMAVSITIALRKTFPQRLAVVKFLNDLASSGTYEKTLRLDAELRTAYKALGRTLQAYSCSSTRPAPSQFEIRVVDFIMHRYLSALHLPYFGPALHETAYAFSRKVVVESSLKIWRAACPSSSSSSSLSLAAIAHQFPAPSSSEWDEHDQLLPRLAVCSSGFYPTVAIHAALLIAVELRTQLQEEENLLGPAMLRPDLFSVLDDAKAWCLRVLEAGETNVKGYLLMSVVTAQIEGLMRGLGKNDVAELMVKAAENVEEKCLPILRGISAALCQVEGAGEGGAVDGLQQASLAAPGEAMEEDWGFMTADALLNPDNIEPLSWMFNDDYNSGVPQLW
ncbi:hypothetical protein CONLIGDRAFT_655445 [Coniochaeta ligniaria NRRL 30616]|uniref:Zn(2)-C6 fungal-type domain-containing protein n=1 Tax=Coniochaeta ligniaria NRRL 30616 TaxID=1408157 RepID=A0A1J7JED3_9PEZI|nr:hypothetical protein CONLIGDRAFT_655445 [Coniochaeta ligniaria NRRL 30616]